MLLSMTGFSSKIVTLPVGRDVQASFSIEIKALNSRFYEYSARLPSSLGSFETALGSLLKNSLVRGRVFLTITPTKQTEGFEVVSPLLSLAKSYVQGAMEIKKACGLSGELSLVDVLALPGVFVSEKTDFSDIIKEPLFREIEAVAYDVMLQRRGEGESLQADIKARLVLCERAIESISGLYKTLIEKQKSEIAQQSNLVLQGDEEAKLRLVPLYDALNKIDIHEEIVRFTSHLKRLAEILDSSGFEKGKQIDFIVQELMRETNTIAAKCSNFDVSSHAVDIKVELEKMREQVQNIL